MMSNKSKPTKPANEQDIVNPLDVALSSESKAEHLCNLSIKNQPTIDKFIAMIDAKYSTVSTSNRKRKERILAKATRPAILSEKPWFNVEHIRDGLRFRTALENLDDLPKIITDLQKEGITIIKAETGKMLKPKAWGWKAVMYDLQLADGQLVEYYLSPKEMITANDQVHHPLYEDWRERDTNTLSESELIKYQKALETSNRAFSMAWNQYLGRTGQTNETVKSILKETDKVTTVKRSPNDLMLPWPLSLLRQLLRRLGWW